MEAAADRAAARFEEHRDGVCRREAANVSARAANPNQQMVLCSAGFVMKQTGCGHALPPRKKRRPLHAAGANPSQGGVTRTTQSD
ncbi:hypothetical protein BURCENBC7_AP6759 [Burkholderia cenocepacia BC7]|nr:hypothetical protein BURCENBC7_AP6759 [Burkholderia cenocepacia BC7]